MQVFLDKVLSPVLANMDMARRIPPQGDLFSADKLPKCHTV